MGAQPLGRRIRVASAAEASSERASRPPRQPAKVAIRVPWAPWPEAELGLGKCQPGTERVGGSQECVWQTRWIMAECIGWGIRPYVKNGEREYDGIQAN